MQSSTGRPDCARTIGKASKSSPPPFKDCILPMNKSRTAPDGDKSPSPAPDNGGSTGKWTIRTRSPNPCRRYSSAMWELVTTSARHRRIAVNRSAELWYPRHRVAGLRPPHRRGRYKAKHAAPNRREQGDVSGQRRTFAPLMQVPKYPCAK